MLKKKYLYEDTNDSSSTKSKEEYINKIKKMKPTQVIELLASNDQELINTLEKGTEAYEIWIDTLESLDVNNVISTKQTLENIRKLKDYVKNNDNLLPFAKDDSPDNREINQNTTGKTSPKKTILDNNQIQDLLCDATRSFVRNIKQEFGNILLAFSSRLIGLMEDLGYENPARGSFYLINDNSSLICKAIINAVSEYNESTPSVVGVQIEKNTKDKRSLGLKQGVSTTLLTKLIKIFDEEVVTNPEEAIQLDSNDKEVIDVTSAINLSDLIHINKTRQISKDNCYSIYTAFRMQKGGYATNFNFGMQIIPITPSSFNVLYYLYLSDNLTKPNGQLPCSDWI